MNLILKKEVYNLGRFGDRVKVADGYARNYLIPRGLAVEATTGNLRQFDAEKDAFVRKAAARKAEAEKLNASLTALTLTFSRKAGEDDKLFGSVTSHDIEGELNAKGFKVEKKDIVLVEPIKALGQFTVAVKLHQEVTSDIKVVVVKE